MAEEKHMISKSMENILENSTKNWCVVVKKGEILVWFMGIFSSGSLYEAGSLYVTKEFRRQWIGAAIQNILFLQHRNIPLILITQVSEVQKFCEILGLNHFSLENIPDRIRNVLEKNWQIVPEEKLYWNKSLFMNNKIL